MIKNIKEGKYVWSLDEKTDKIVARKVNALLEHGVKPIYEIVTEHRRVINTTAEHPCLVKTRLNDYLSSPVSVSSSSSSVSSLSLELFILASNSNKSLVVYILISDCCLNAGSSDQIGVLLRINDNAKYGSSLVSSPCGESLLASLRNSSYLSSDINSISSSIVERVNSNSPTEFLEKCIILSLSDLNSSKMKYGEISLQPQFNNSSTICLLVESFLKNENSILASTINSLGKTAILYQPHLLTALSFALDDNSSICSSLNSDLDMILSNIENLTLLTNCLTTILKADSNLLFNSAGTSNLITISSMKYYKNRNYINLLEKKDYNEDIRLEKIALIKKHKPQHVHDLTLEGTHNFIANNAAAHNTKPYKMEVKIAC